jgi:hypothetical protein
LGLGALCVLVLAGCSKQEEEVAGATAADEVGRPLADMELPVSLRTGDSAPNNAFTIEATTEQLRIEGAPVVALDKGKVEKTDQNNGTIPKLLEKLKGGRSGIVMRLAANVPYETTALILNTAKQAGLSEAAFQVRKVGATNAVGHVNVSGYVMASKADDVPPITAVEHRSWDDFVAKWEEVKYACRTGKTSNCAYVDDNPAIGGTLKIELFASGRGVNVDFYRRGLTPEQEAEEAENRKRYLAGKKEDFLQGRISHDDMVKILLLGDPSTQALFQFRNTEVLESPSAVSRTMAPMCHSERCGVVVASDPITPLVLTMTMLGAGFPDGTPMPALAFEMPWTKRPKVAIPQWALEKDPALEIATELGIIQP